MRWDKTSSTKKNITTLAKKTIKKEQEYEESGIGKQKERNKKAGKARRIM